MNNNDDTQQGRSSEDLAQIAKQLQNQEDQVYGDETVSGTNPRPDSDDDVEAMMENVTGNDPTAINANGTPNDDYIAQEVNKDKIDRHTTAPIIQDANPNNDDAPVSNLNENIDADAIASPAGISENLAESTGDPFDALTDSDLGVKKNQ